MHVHHIIVKKIVSQECKCQNNAGFSATTLMHCMSSDLLAKLTPLLVKLQSSWKGFVNISCRPWSN